MRKHVNTKVFGALQDFIPICARCGNMHDDGGYWVKVTSSCRPEFGIGEVAYCICSQCARKLYPEDYNQKSDSITYVE